ncbi:MAG: hypothetical protein Kow0092_20490 [Deferrisomatales bacterium]
MRRIDQSWTNRVGAALAAALLVLALGACGSEDSVSIPTRQATSSGTDGGDSGGGTGGDTGSGTAGEPTLTLGAPSPATVTAGSDPAQVTATLLDADGQPLSGQTVTFQVTPSTVAKADATTAVTDSDGKASVQVSGLKAGTATIRAQAALVGAVSESQSLSVVAPTISVAAADDTIQASAQGSGGTVVTATVTDPATSQGISGLTVTVSTSLGELTSVKDLGDGTYQTTLTSTQAGTATVTASALGATSDSVEVEVEAGALAALVLTPSPSQIAPGETSTLTASAQDAFGNPSEGTVTFTLDATPSGIATLSESSVALADGEAAVTLTATAVGLASVTATLGATSQTEEVVIAEAQEGVPALVNVAVDPDTIPVGNSVSTITVTVTDIFRNPIDDVANNVELEVTSGPPDVRLGGKSFGETLLLTSDGGVVSAALESGVTPGTVKIAARVVRRQGQSGPEDLTTPLTPLEPAKVVIESGPPFSLFLGRSTHLVNNKDGTYTHEYFALVSDRYGNAVRDGTAVYFGLFLNILAEGTDGAISDGSATFTSAAATFETAGASFGDTLVLLEGDSRGGYVVEEVTGETALDVFTTFASDESGLSYAVGNNGGLGGAVILPDEGVATTVDGKATWVARYSVEFINAPAYVHAETEGRTVGSARGFSLGFLADATITVLSGPTQATAGSTLDFEVGVEDGGDPPIPIPDLPVFLTVDIPSADVGVNDGDFDGTGENSEVVLTGPDNGNTRGVATFSWTVPAAAAKDDEFTITIRAADALATHKVTVIE